MTRAKGGHSRSKKASKKRIDRWLSSPAYEKCREKWTARTGEFSVENKIAKYPDEFLAIQSSSKVVAKQLRIHFPGLQTRQLESADSTRKLLFPVPTPENRLLDPLHPPYLAMRFPSVVSPKTNSRLVLAWDKLLASGVKFPKVDPNRSTTPALHLGIWEIFSSKPFISANSRQTPEVNKSIDIFLGLVGKLLAPKIGALLKEHCPDQYARQIQAYSRVKRILGPELVERPTMDFTGSFFSVAVKEGSSEKVHIDFNDDINGITWVVPLGDWEGGEFCAPQLGYKIPIIPGQILGVMTKLLAHCGAPVTNGRRIVLTLFSDRFLLGHSDKDTRKRGVNIV
ncbi:hypothetical protein BDN70DRAFT_898616 [Pholiota conissans]|uniref:2OGFeDO JBP1/TET oxygenase domain-containing protein n=1 Tax=Pholiota conissans TaxID=109636 RepID=A0A9P5YVY3_9AGAR|nr:hypothetical protein BDN70DRAFT_898616 [Pholiota conissans]